MILGTGITVSWGGAIAEILDVTPPGASRESIDVTHMGTTVARKFLPSKLYDGGSLALSIGFDPSEARFHTTATASSCVITFPDSDSTTWTFDAFVTAYDPTGPLEDKMTADLTLKVDGVITVAP